MHGSDELAKWALTYQPIIDALEKGEVLYDEASGWQHPVLFQFERDATEEFGEGYVCILGADQLQVAEVDGPFRIEEYEGSESIVLPEHETWITL